jgi:hypothetical protein
LHFTYLDCRKTLNSDFRAKVLVTLCGAVELGNKCRLVSTKVIHELLPIARHGFAVPAPLNDRRNNEFSSAVHPGLQREPVLLQRFISDLHGAKNLMKTLFPLVCSSHVSGVRLRADAEDAKARK